MATFRVSEKLLFGFKEKLKKVEKVGLPKPSLQGPWVTTVVDIVKGNSSHAGTLCRHSLRFKCRKTARKLLKDIFRKTAGRLQENCRKTAGKLQENCRTIAGQLQELCRKIVRKLQGNCRTIAGNLQENCKKLQGYCRTIAGTLQEN